MNGEQKQKAEQLENLRCGAQDAKNDLVELERDIAAVKAEIIRLGLKLESFQSRLEPARARIAETERLYAEAQ